MICGRQRTPFYQHWKGFPRPRPTRCLSPTSGRFASFWPTLQSFRIARNAVESDLRVAAVTDHGADDMADLVRQVIAANDRVVQVVGGIDPSTLDRPGHREGNPITAGGVIRYVAGHVRTHAEQIAESLRLIRQKV